MNAFSLVFPHIRAPAFHPGMGARAGSYGVRPLSGGGPHGINMNMVSAPEQRHRAQNCKQCCQQCQTDHFGEDVQVVPETVGTLLDQMVVLRLQRMKPLPARVNKAALREYAQPEQRAQLATLARRIAAFAEGMRAMEKCVDLSRAVSYRGKLRRSLRSAKSGVQRELYASVYALVHSKECSHCLSLQSFCCCSEHCLTTSDHSARVHDSTGAD